MLTFEHLGLLGLGPEVLERLRLVNLDGRLDSLQLLQMDLVLLLLPLSREQFACLWLRPIHYYLYFLLCQV